MRVKKYFSIFLSFVFAFVTVSSTIAMENNNQRKIDKSKVMEFYKKSSDLIRENWNDNYFESIKLKVGEDYLIVDNDKKIKLSSKVSMKDDVIILPVKEIVDLSGGKINQDDKNIQINYLGNDVKLEEGSKKIQVNDNVKSIGSKVTVNDDNVIVPIDVLSKGLGYTYKYDKKSKEVELTSPYQTMRLIVKLKNDNVNLDKYKPVKTIKKGLNNIFVLQFNSIEDTKLACEQIQKDNISVYVEPDYYVSAESTGKVSSKKDASATYNSWGVEYIEAEKYSKYLQNQNLSNSITVGVVDTGIDDEHPIFKNRIDYNGYDFVNSDYYPYDDHGHGTHVSGTIVDCTPGLSINILPVKVMDSDGTGTGLNIANGIEYSTYMGADVINFSIAMGSHWSYIHDVIDYAISNNVVVVIAAGNNDNDTFYECPSDMNEAIVVSAIDSYGDKCYFSNYGSTIDVAAPGEYIYSAYPGGGYTYMDGTSMAAPHISAVCAMYRLKYPNLNVYEVEDLVQKNTKDLGASGWDQYYGYGVPHLSLAIPKEAPEKVQNVKASSKSYNSIKITWNKATGADGYKIYRASSKSGKYSAIKTVTSASTLSYTNTGLTTGKTYYYKVRAYTTINGSKVYGSYSSVVSAKPSLSKPTSKVSSLTYSSNKVTWNKISGASGYEVYRATSKSGTYSKVKTITSGSTLSYTNTGLTTGKTYYYKVRAYRYVSGKKVYSSYSSIVSAKPSLSKPSLYLSAGSKKAYIKWSKISGASGYEIYRASSKNGYYSKIKTITSGKTTSYTNSKLTRKKTYYYKVRAYRYVSGKKVYSSYSSIKYVKIK